MEKIATRYFWVVNALTLALLAYFLAAGSAEIIAGKIADRMPGVSTTDASPSAARPQVVAPSVPRGDVILSRNIFDHTARGLDKEPEPPPQAVVPEGPLPLIRCTSSAKLVTLLASSRSPEHSWVMVEMGGKRTSMRLGESFEGRTISAITWRYLLLKGTTDECYIDMFQDPNAPPPPPQVTAATEPAKGTPVALAGEIQVDNELERTVPRSVVDQALANPTMFANSVRVRPYRQDGKVTGFRLRTVDKGSPLELLGAQRGDIIHSVNGVPLTSVDQALSAYQGLRTQDRLTFSVTRRGQPVDLKINIK